MKVDHVDFDKSHPNSVLRKSYSSPLHRMPATGEGWRHHTGRLFEIVGTAVQMETGRLQVIYTTYRCGSRVPIYVEALEGFLELMSDGVERFRFERDADEDERAADKATKET